MLEYKDVQYQLKCKKKSEEIFCAVQMTKKETWQHKTEFTKTYLGNGICNLLKDKEKIKQFMKKIETNIGEYVKYSFENKKRENYLTRPEDLNYNSIKDNLTIVFNELLKISPYFILSQKTFINCQKKIEKDIIYSEDYNELYRKYINEMLDKIVNALEFKGWRVNGKKFLKLPTALVNCKERESDFEFEYIYDIENLDEFIRISYYQLKLNNYYIKKCKYPKCLEYFVTKDNRHGYCTNPSPDEKSLTCREAKERRKFDSDKEPTEFEEKLNELDDLRGRVRGRFRDNIKRVNIKEKESLEKNKEKFNIYSTEIRNKIKLLMKKEEKVQEEQKDKEKYLEVYDKFLNDIYNQFVNSNNIKVTKPKY